VLSSRIPLEYLCVCLEIFLQYVELPLRPSATKLSLVRHRSRLLRRTRARG
jgi:hypothetical protein